MGRGHGFIPGDTPVSPADKVQRRATLRRASRLFRPYKRRLGALLFLILVSALLGVVPAFLVRAIFDEAIPNRNTAQLTVLVAGMIAIAIASGIIGVGQTWLSN